MSWELSFGGIAMCYKGTILVCVVSVLISPFVSDMAHHSPSDYIPLNSLAPSIFSDMQWRYYLNSQLSVTS